MLGKLFIGYCIFQFLCLIFAILILGISFYELYNPAEGAFCATPQVASIMGVGVLAIPFGFGNGIWLFLRAKLDVGTAAFFKVLIIVSLVVWFSIVVMFGMGFGIG